MRKPSGLTHHSSLITKPKKANSGKPGDAKPLDLNPPGYDGQAAEVSSAMYGLVPICRELGAWFSSFREVSQVALPDSVLAQRALERYSILVIGGDAVFLVDRAMNHKLYLGLDKNVGRPEIRRYVDSLNRDLKDLSVGDFLLKHGLRR